MQAGTFAVVLAAAPYKMFDLDRFFVPKELALLVSATIAIALVAAAARRWSIGRVDQLLGAFLAVSTASALLATNRWLAERSLAITLAGAGCFWVARRLGRAGLGHPLVAALALAGVLGAVTALLQAYGLQTEFVSLNRAPGGTFGNRNFMAHLCAITLPALLFTGLAARTHAAFLRWCAGAAAVGAALVLSRSRAAWLAFVLVAVVALVMGALALRRGRDGTKLGRVPILLLAGIAGGAASLVIPNTLDWRSDSPYLDTAKSVVNYREGSGHGRLVQYGNSLKMSARHPLFGVGPGNWTVEYPRFASREDPSIGSSGMTSNPWSSSDWITFLSERGLAATLLLGLAIFALLADAWRAMRDDDDSWHRLSACALVATMAALIVTGAFDAVLLLPAPAFVGWSLLGALSAPCRERRAVTMGTARRVLFVVAIVLAGGAMIARSALQLQAMAIAATTGRAASLERASRLDPGSYRIHLRLAQAYLGQGSCTNARMHAEAAAALFPSAPAPARVLSRCGGLNAR